MAQVDSKSAPAKPVVWISADPPIDDRREELKKLNPAGRVYVGLTGDWGSVRRRAPIGDGRSDALPTAPITTDMVVPPTVREVAKAYLRDHNDSNSNMQDLLDAIRHSSDDTIDDAIEFATRTQGDCEEWRRQRWGRATATKAHCIKTYMGSRGGFFRRLTPTSALKQVRKRYSLRYGHRVESFDPGSTLVHGGTRARSREKIFWFSDEISF
jgi:hypothetical protein